MKAIYIDKDELLDYLNSSNNICEGIAYEWEGEDVAHLHLTPLAHSFGRKSRCHWTKTDVANEATASEEFSVQVKSENDLAVFYNRNGILEPCKVNFIPSREEMFSRAKGILEVDILTDKRVMIIGLGSFGSQIAIELAKAGVGHFALFDFDRVELHNLARHTCTIKDLGRLKTDAIKEAILGKNKLATVELFPIDINMHKELMDEEVAKADIVICATDNNPSRFSLTQSLLRHNKVAIFGRAVTRAEGGDVFRHRPGGPCYNCLVGSAAFTAAEEITNRSQLPAYVSEAEANAVIQVGLSSDIEPICNLMVKLTLIELARGQNSGIESLENELTYDYYMWANRRERRHGKWAPFNNAGKMPTILRWYGAKIAKDEHCPSCSDTALLDLGEELNIEGLIKDYSAITLDTGE